MVTPRAPESRLLLACLQRQPQALEPLLCEGLNWQAIIERAEQYGITPFVSMALKQVAGHPRIPPEVWEAISGLSRDHAYRTMNVYLKLQDILSALTQAGIEVIVLKGAAIAVLVYSDMALRSMLALDLLVREGDLDTAEMVLTSLGYRPDESVHALSWFRDHHHHLAPYVAEDQSLALDLHHHLIQPTAQVGLSMRVLWERAQPVQIASASAYVLAPQDLLMHLCLHLVNNLCLEGMGKLRALRDIDETVQQYHAEINWEGWVRQIIDEGVASYIYYALWLSKHLLAATVPEAVLISLKKAVRGDGLQDRCLKFLFVRAMFRHPPAASPVPSWLMADMCCLFFEQTGMRRVFVTLTRSLYDRYKHSAQQTVPHLRQLLPLYTLGVHPFYLLVRTSHRTVRTLLQRQASG